ncbi:hypothetical protein Tco_0058218 [Tanacetum coccineum]
MSASRQGMSSEEMEQVVAQRVANAIEAIAIYESKIRMAHNSMNQVVREEATVGKNVSNKRKWGSDHGRDSDQQQSKRIEVVRAHATGAGNKKAYAGNSPYRNKCCFIILGRVYCESMDSALTWYNSHKRTIGTDVTYAMTWKALIKLMTEGNDLTAYTQRFQELILLYTKMVLEEEDRVEKFIGGMLRTREGLIKIQEITVCNNHPLRGRIWKWLTRLGTITRRAMLESYHSATNACFTTTVHAPLSVETARRLATNQETVGPLPR